MAGSRQPELRITMAFNYFHTLPNPFGSNILLLSLYSNKLSEREQKV